MAWTPLPPDRPPAGWWVEREDQRLLDAGLDRARELKVRQLRRQAERVAEACVIALGADEARRHVRRQGMPFEDIRLDGRRVDGRGHVRNVEDIRLDGRRVGGPSGERFVRSHAHGGYQLESGDALGEIEYSTHVGRILGVR